MPLFSIFSLLALCILVPESQYLSYSQIENNSNLSNVWTTERNYLNITMKIVFEVPIIDQNTIFYLILGHFTKACNFRSHDCNLSDV